MDAMEPLIITSNDPMILTGPREIDETVEQGIAAAKAGAAIIHRHLIYNPTFPAHKLNSTSTSPLKPFAHCAAGLTPSSNSASRLPRTRAGRRWPGR